MGDDYITALDAAKRLKMSPARFAELLRKERGRLPLEVNYEDVCQMGDYHRQQGYSFKINGNWAEKIYAESFDMVSYFPILMIHRLDWKAFLSGREDSHTSIEQLRRELEAAQARIAELEQELATCREQLEEARRADSSGNEDTESFFETYPVCKLIYDLHHAGKSQDEIRVKLTTKGYTNAQTGFITQNDTIPRTDDAIKKSVMRSKNNK